MSASRCFPWSPVAGARGLYSAVGGEEPGAGIRGFGKVHKSGRVRQGRTPLQTSTAPTRQARAMTGRQCGVCRYGDSRLAEGSLGEPSAACVLAFSCKAFHGRDGILARMEAMSVESHVPLASAYCMKCRRSTWLSRAENDIKLDCVDFMRHWSDAQQIKSALPVMQKALKPKYRRSNAGKVSTTRSGSQLPEPGSTAKTSKRSRCV